MSVSTDVYGRLPAWIGAVETLDRLGGPEALWRVALRAEEARERTYEVFEFVVSVWVRIGLFDHVQQVAGHATSVGNLTHCIGSGMVAAMVAFDRYGTEP